MMKRKFLVVLMAIASTFCLTFGLSACGEKDSDETGKNPPITDPSGSNQGNQGNEGSGTQKPDDGEQGDTQKPDDGEQGEISDEEEKNPYSFLPEVAYSKSGLRFELSVYDAQGFSVSKGDFEGAELTIPKTFYGIPVVGIKEEAFKDCSKLTKITIPDTVKYIGIDAFKGSAYYNDKSHWDDGILYIGHHLIKTEDTIFDSVSIRPDTKTIADGAFMECDGLEKIEIPDSVEILGEYTFKNCTRLNSISIGNGVTEIGQDSFVGTKFYNDESHLDEYGVFYIDQCLIRAKYNLPNKYSVQSGTRVIADRAMAACTQAEEITIPDSVTSIGWESFVSCERLMSISVAEQNPNFSSANGVLYNKEKTKLIQAPQTISSIEIPSSVTSIGYKAFANCLYLKTIKIPKGITSIGNFAFNDCSSLTSVTMENGVTDIGSAAFQYCYIQRVTIPDSVVVIRSCAFNICEQLTSVALGEHVSGIGERAFAYCSCLETIEIPASVTLIGDEVFDQCFSLTSISVSEQNQHYSSVNGVLYNKEKTLLIEAPQMITSIDIPNSVTSIGASAFCGCSGLTSVDIPDSVTKIGDWAFWSCTGLTSINIPNSVTSIGSGAFEWCSRLTSIDIPDSVTSIGAYAFADCDKLNEIHFKNPNGWKVSHDEDISNAEDISGLEDPATATKYLTDTYRDYYWKRG